jgi:hypothetical protein
MNALRDRCRLLPAALLLLAAGACDVDVRERGNDKEVDVRSAIGDISVRTREGGAETGLPVYPGARPLHDADEEPANADVAVATPFMGVRVAAAKFESDAAPRAIVDFYKDRMTAFGTVMECRGDVEFEGEADRPVCRQDGASAEIQLVAGEGERNHRMVAVKPRGAGSEFALVHVRVDEPD